MRDVGGGGVFSAYDDYCFSNVQGTSRTEALDRRLFGDGEPIDDFDERCGQLIYVPRERGIWWLGDELDFVGMHDGLHPDEMLVPFAATNLGRLQ